MTLLRATLLCGGVLLVTGCVQDPAEVSYRGDEFYGHVHEAALDSPNHQTYPEDSPRLKPEYARPVKPAQVQAVGVSDLPPPVAQTASVAPQTTTHPWKTAEADTGEDTQFVWPVSGGKIVSHFGPKAAGRSNDGINIAMAEGEPIWAAASGTVVYSGSDLKGYGNMIIIRHKDGWMTAYAHARTLSVKKNQVVKQGDIIAYVGMTGDVQTPQLHFAIRNGRTPVDPELYLPKNVAGQ